ncbi:MAG: 1,4-alpha-glucan branching protein [Chitinophagaceae bacterium]|nr:1,4-alpha-glucan branching protein [Chitinophagaceae bacterium]
MEQTKRRPVEWAHTTNIYEVNLRQYSEEGTFSAFGKELPRLKDMGVHTLWFMPITPIAQKNKKGSMGSQYACSDYTSVSPEFGTLDDFRKLVKQAQSMGFKVIIDWVANHTGWDHWWTVKHPDYYKMDPATNDFKRASGMDDIIELDYDNPALRQAMIDAMRFWVKEAGIDGYRCDLASWVQADFWEEARPQVDAIKPLLWLGEFDELQNPEHGKVFDVSYAWKWMHKTQDFYQRHQPFNNLYELLKHYSEIGDDSMRAWFTSNHDENSWNGTEYEKYGNMAKALAVFSCTWNGVPLLYNGQELPLNKRLEFFEKDVIPWNGKYELHDFYKTLLKLKAENPALRAGDPDVKTHRVATSDDTRAFVYQRKSGDREVLVVFNFSYEAVLKFWFCDDSVKGIYRNVFTNEERDLTKDTRFQLGAWEYAVFEK